MVSADTYSRLAMAAAAVALAVIVLGAFVRLSHAGLSCPDWPGCYGQIGVPETRTEAAQAGFERELDRPRAWKEMIHRYLAGGLGLAILGLALLASRRRYRPGQQLVVPWLLVALVIGQALLGMWTVTLLLKPIVVLAHLLGGFTIAALLWWLALRQGVVFVSSREQMGGAMSRAFRPWILLGIVVLYAQISLGGWTSANYAALACPDLPTCQGRWVPDLDLGEALVPWRGTGQNYEGGVLDSDARATIHWLHRIGAALTFAYLGALALAIMTRARSRPLAAAAGVMLLVLLAQLALGVGNVVLGLPIEVAVAHNAVAALLLLALVTVYHVARPPGLTL